eukprot:TRINITY_DN356_c0_g1_i4.p1 TRINITY_DN356_c0_g1~~TRINITY_DN356_c0_g1_i4.p1  ORF type:complete len:136 (+),score=7.65 TRINITY_DN356_c0_g1_i4:39-410(+)
MECHWALARDSGAVVNPFMQVTNEVTKSFATLEPSELRRLCQLMLYAFMITGQQGMAARRHVQMKQDVAYPLRLTAAAGMEFAGIQCHLRLEQSSLDQNHENDAKHDFNELKHGVPGEQQPQL